MNHQHKRHRTIARLKKKLKHVAAAAAGAVILSGALVPGAPPATVHAAADPNVANTPVAVTQQVATDKTGGPAPVSLNESVAHDKTAPPHEKNTKPDAKPAQQETDKTTVSGNSDVSHQAPADYQQVINIKATAYAPGPHDNDQWGNKTYTGEEVRPGVIAVDPSVIPLGSRVYIQYPDGHGEYAIAADTGGAIKGNRIDVAKWTVGEAQDFGVQNVKVFIVHTPENV